MQTGTVKVSIKKVYMWEICCPFCSIKSYTENKFEGIWQCDNCEETFAINTFDIETQFDGNYYISNELK